MTLISSSGYGERLPAAPRKVTLLTQESHLLGVVADAATAADSDAAIAEMVTVLCRALKS